MICEFCDFTNPDVVCKLDLKIVLKKEFDKFCTKNNRENCPRYSYYLGVYNAITKQKQKTPIIQGGLQECSETYVKF